MRIDQVRPGAVGTISLPLLKRFNKANLCVTVRLITLLWLWWEAFIVPPTLTCSPLPTLPPSRPSHRPLILSRSPQLPRALSPCPLAFIPSIYPAPSSFRAPTYNSLLATTAPCGAGRRRLPPGPDSIWCTLRNITYFTQPYSYYAFYAA